MNAIAIEAQEMVREAAKPIRAGATVKEQMRDAARSLGYGRAFWRVRAAWYGEAGSWSASAFRDLQQRYSAFKRRGEARACANADVARARLVALRAALAATDEDFHREQIVALDAALAAMGDGDRAVDGADD